MKNYIMLDLYSGYAEDASVSHLLVTWTKKSKFKNPLALRDKFIDDFADVARAIHPNHVPLTQTTVDELIAKKYDVPVYRPYALAGIFNSFAAGTTNTKMQFIEDLNDRGWYVANYRTGTVVVVSNFDGYLDWLDNSDSNDIPEHCARILKTYDIKL